MIKAVFWDYGGVFTTSPFESFALYEKEQGLPKGFIRGVNSTNPDHNAWARLERNEVSLPEFDELFLAEATRLGHPVRGAAVLALLRGRLRPQMVAALRRCSESFGNACLTNNFNAGDTGDSGDDDPFTAKAGSFMHFFDEVIESRRVGLRKPSPEFYHLACELMAVEPSEVVFLDDLGINLKPARQMGMTTIKVVDPDRAIRELSSALAISL